MFIRTNTAKFELFQTKLASLFANEQYKYHLETNFQLSRRNSPRKNKIIKLKSQKHLHNLSKLKNTNPRGIQSLQTKTLLRSSTFNDTFELIETNLNLQNRSFSMRKENKQRKKIKTSFNNESCFQESENMSINEVSDTSGDKKKFFSILDGCLAEFKDKLIVNTKGISDKLAKSISEQILLSLAAYKVEKEDKLTFYKETESMYLEGFLISREKRRNETTFGVGST